MKSSLSEPAKQGAAGLAVVDLPALQGPEAAAAAQTGPGLPMEGPTPAPAVRKGNVMSPRLQCRWQQVRLCCRRWSHAGTGPGFQRAPLHQLGAVIQHAWEARPTTLLLYCDMLCCHSDLAASNSSKWQANDDGIQAAAVLVAAGVSSRPILLQVGKGHSPMTPEPAPARGPMVHQLPHSWAVVRRRGQLAGAHPSWGAQARQLQLCLQGSCSPKRRPVLTAIASVLHPCMWARHCLAQ